MPGGMIFGKRSCSLEGKGELALAGQRALHLPAYRPGWKPILLAMQRSFGCGARSWTAIGSWTDGLTGCHRILDCHRRHRDAAAQLRPLPRRLGCRLGGSFQPLASPQMLLSLLLLWKQVDIIQGLGMLCFSFRVLYFNLFAAWGQSHTGWCWQQGKAAFWRFSQPGQVLEGQIHPLSSVRHLVTALWRRKELPSQKGKYFCAPPPPSLHLCMRSLVCIHPQTYFQAGLDLWTLLFKESTFSHYAEINYMFFLVLRFVYLLSCFSFPAEHFELRLTGSSFKYASPKTC